MEQKNKLKMFENGVKLIALYQATLEQMDTMKSTVLYKHNIKKMMRTLEKEIERSIRGPLIQLDATDETMMSTIQYKVEAILDLSLQELAMLKMVVEDHRELNPIKEK